MPSRDGFFMPAISQNPRNDYKMTTKCLRLFFIQQKQKKTGLKWPEKLRGRAQFDFKKTCFRRLFLSSDKVLIFGRGVGNGRISYTWSHN